MLKERKVEVVGCPWMKSQLISLEEFEQLFSIYEFNWRGSRTFGLCTRLTRKGTGCQEDPFLRSAVHGSAKVTDLLRWHGLFPFLALKDNAHAQQIAYLKNAGTVDATIAGPSSDLHPVEAGLAQEAHAKPFETTGRQRQQHTKKVLQADVFFALRRHSCNVGVLVSGLSIASGLDLSADRMSAHLLQEQFSTLLLRQMRRLTLRRERPNSALARIDQSGPNEILSSPVDLVVEAFLTRLENSVPELVRHLLLLGDSIKCLARGR